MSNNTLSGIGALLQGLNSTFFGGWDRIQAANAVQREQEEKAANLAALQEYAQASGAQLPAVEGISPAVFANMLSVDMNNRRQAEQDRRQQVADAQAEAARRATSMLVMNPSLANPGMGAATGDMWARGQGGNADIMQADPSTILKIREMNKPDKATKPFGVGGNAVYDPTTREWIPNPYAEQDAPKEDPRLKGIRDKVQSLVKQQASIIAGEGLAPNLQPGDPKALALLDMRVRAFAKQYADLGGDPKDLGLEVEKSPEPEPKKLDSTTAMEILNEAGGDKEQARKIAKERGYSF